MAFEHTSSSKMQYRRMRATCQDFPPATFFRDANRGVILGHNTVFSSYEDCPMSELERRSTSLALLVLVVVTAEPDLAQGHVTGICIDWPARLDLSHQSLGPVWLHWKVEQRGARLIATQRLHCFCCLLEYRLFVDSARIGVV